MATAPHPVNQNDVSEMEVDKKVVDHIERSNSRDSKDAKNDDSSHVRSAFANLPTRLAIRKFWRLYLCGLSVSLAGMYTGYTINAPGNIVANAGFIEVFGTHRNPTTGALELDATHISLWSGMMSVSQIISQALSPISGDKWGRRINMWMFTLAMVVAIIMNIFATNWKVYLGAKIMAGISCGFLGSTVMTYMSEITIPQMRGSLLSSFSLSFSLGGLFSAVGLQVLQETAPFAFRRIFYSEFALLAVWMVPLLLLPESPVWLAGKGRHEKAKKALRRLVGGKIEGYDQEHEYAVILAEVEQSKALQAAKGDNDWASLFKGVNRKRALISTIPFTFQNIVGVPLVYGQTTYFFQTAGLDNAFLASLIISIITIVGIITSFYLVERLGRRTLVLWGSGFCIVMNVVIGAMGCVELTPGLATGLIVICSLWVASYSISLAPIGWMALVEISTPALRAKTAAVATVLQSLSGVLFNYTVPLMLSPQKAGWGTKIGFFFAGISILYWIPTYFYFPETKNRSYAALDELFEAGVSPRRFAQTPTAAGQAEDMGLEEVRQVK